eukprot:12661566-Alexandrium_andersonii.AAC.1
MKSSIALASGISIDTSSVYSVLSRTAHASSGTQPKCASSPSCRGRWRGGSRGGGGGRSPEGESGGRSRLGLRPAALAEAPGAARG